MRDLYVDYEAVEETRHRLADIAETLRGPSRELVDLPSSAVGHESLRSALADFGDGWEFGIGKLAEFADRAAQALDGVVSAFTDLDQQMAAVFSPRATQVSSPGCTPGPVVVFSPRATQVSGDPR